MLLYYYYSSIQTLLFKVLQYNYEYKGGQSLWRHRAAKTAAHMAAIHTGHPAAAAGDAADVAPEPSQPVANSRV